MDEGYRWGGGADLSPWETVMWRADADPHTRSAGVFVEILEHEPDWDRYVEALERSTRLVPRLRERIVEPALPLVAPAWSTDEEFAIEHHVSRARIPTPGTTAQLHEKVADVMRRPLDRGRPPWVAVLLTGLEGGRAASVFKAHHVLADGQLLMQLLELLHGHSPEPGSRHVPARPARPTVDRYSLVATRLARNAVAAPRGLVRQLAGMPSALVHPVRSVGGAIAYARSLRRQVSPVGVPRSPLLRGQGGTGVRVLTLTVPLAEMRAAGKAAGGSVNDAFLAAMLGGLRRYHEHFHVEVDRIPLTMPVSTRVAGDPAGNRFAAVHLVGPMSEADPARRIALIREQVRAARNEPALDWLEVGSRFIDKLPRPGPRRGRPQRRSDLRRPAVQLPRRAPRSLHRRGQGHRDLPRRPPSGGGDDGGDDQLPGPGVRRSARRPRRVHRPRGPRLLPPRGFRRGAHARVDGPDHPVPATRSRREPLSRT
jgi:diacylglycerol O-acyltransferase